MASPDTRPVDLPMSLIEEMEEAALSQLRIRRSWPSWEASSHMEQASRTTSLDPITRQLGNPVESGASRMLRLSRARALRTH